MLRKFTAGVLTAVLFLVSSIAMAEELVPPVKPSVERIQVECLRFLAEDIFKVVCVHPKAQLTAQDMEMFTWYFMWMLNEDRKGWIPITSWLDASVYEGVKTFIYLSDGTAHYAAGSGELMVKAMADMERNFGGRSR